MKSSTYERTVTAALNERTGKIDLASALAADIPADTDEVVRERLLEARQAVIDAGGEPRSVGTLADYRSTGLWASGGFVSGVSYTAHTEARRGGLSYAEFVDLDSKTVDAIRAMVGKAGTDGPPTRIAQSWTPEQRTAVAKELLADESVAAEVEADLDTRVRLDRVGRDRKAREGDTVCPGPVGSDELSEASASTDAKSALGNVNRWMREVVALLPHVDIDEGFVDATRPEVDRINARWEYVVGALSSRTASLDDELAELIGEGR